MTTARRAQQRMTCAHMWIAPTARHRSQATATSGLHPQGNGIGGNRFNTSTRGGPRTQTVVASSGEISVDTVTACSCRSRSTVVDRNVEDAGTFLRPPFWFVHSGDRQLFHVQQTRTEQMLISVSSNLCVSHFVRRLLNVHSFNDRATDHLIFNCQVISFQWGIKSQDNRLWAPAIRQCQWIDFSYGTRRITSDPCYFSLQ